MTTDQTTQYFEDASQLEWMPGYAPDNFYYNGIHVVLISTEIKNDEILAWVYSGPSIQLVVIND